MKSAYLTLYQALKKYEEVMRSTTNSLGIRPLDVHVLIELDTENVVIASELAKAVKRVATNFTPVLDSLEARNFIERVTHPTDRRAIRIKLTEKGKNLVKELRICLDQFDESFFVNLNEDERLVFLNLLDKIA